MHSVSLKRGVPYGRRRAASRRREKSTRATVKRGARVVAHTTSRRGDCQPAARTAAVARGHAHVDADVIVDPYAHAYARAKLCVHTRASARATASTFTHTASHAPAAGLIPRPHGRCNPRKPPRCTTHDKHSPMPAVLQRAPLRGSVLNVGTSSIASNHIVKSHCALAGEPCACRVYVVGVASVWRVGVLDEPQCVTCAVVFGALPLMCAYVCVCVRRTA